MKYKYDFTSTGKIDSAFEVCFGERRSKDKTFQSKLFEVEQKRHLILHRAGIVDESILQKINTSYVLGERIKLTTFELGNALEEVFLNGWDLIERTETFLIETRAKEHAKDEANCEDRIQSR